MRFFWSIFLLSVVIIFACTEDDILFPPTNNGDCVKEEQPIFTADSFPVFPPSDTLYGKASALKLYKPYCFGGKIISFLDFNSYLIRFSTVLDTAYNDVFTEILDINFRVLEKGCFRVTDNLSLLDDTTKVVHTFYSFYEIDVILDYYDLKDTSSISFEITEIDSVECIVKGKFDLTFLRDTSTKRWYGNPDYLRFINGDFCLDFPE